MSKKPHLATLDGMRGFAAIAVLLFHDLNPLHLPLGPAHGQLAVDFFFCLSGFVVTYAYEPRLKDGLKFLDFVAARVIRLYPLLAVGLLLGVVAYVAKCVSAHQSIVSRPFLISFFCELFSVPSPVVLDSKWNEFTPFDPPAWSLFFEFMACFVYAFLVRRLTNHVGYIFLGLGLLLVFLNAFAFGGIGRGYMWVDVWVGLSRILYPFLSGVLLCRLLSEGRFSGRLIGAARLTPVLLLLIFYCPKPVSYNWLLESSAVLFVFPTVVALGAFDQPSKRMQPIYLFLGEISYPLYVLHYPLLRFFSNISRKYAVTGPSLWALVGMELIVQTGISYMALRYFDAPIRAALTKTWAAYRAKTEINAGKAPNLLEQPQEVI